MFEQTERKSLKRAPPEDFINKMTDETLKWIKRFKRIKRSTVLVFINKGYKYKASNSIMEKIDKA